MRRSLCAWGGGCPRAGDERIDVLVRPSDDACERADRGSVALVDQALAQDAVAAGDELHDRLVRLDFGERFTALDRVASVLSHLTRRPSSIVGESASMKTLVAIGRS